MKTSYTDDEIEFLDAMRRLSPEVRARIDRLINSWIKKNKENANNVIQFVKNNSNRKESKS